VHALRPTLALTLVAMLATAAAAAARPSSGTDLCRLLTGKQAMSVQGVSSKCTNARPTAGPGSTISTANWAGVTPRSPRLQVTMSVYTDRGAFQLAKRNLGQGLPGAPRKVSGIGSAAYEANGGFSTGIRFSVGKHIVLVSVTGIGKPSWSTRSVEALARAIAGRL
jgi:hypothetical protein